MLKVKRIENVIDQVKLLLDIYDLTKDKYCNAQEWIAKMVDYFLTKNQNQDRELYATYFGDMPIAFMMLKRSECKISLLFKAPGFESMGSISLLLEQILKEDTFWTISIPKTLEAQYTFLFKYYGFEKLSEDYYNVIYQYGNAKTYLDKQKQQYVETTKEGE